MINPPDASEPLDTRIEEVRESMVDYDFFARFNGEIKGESGFLAEQWADQNLRNVGDLCLSSPLFWELYDDGIEDGLLAHEALLKAKEKMPKLF